ncbi:E3 ubiquitin-protein ligase ZNRF3 [Metarhizium brunneum]|uniref:E3 ubiquitin-protein ligase ZNRF3 n=1 Tax=Metarhizium brunneum TaxID=500148 RepID=A0A7D5Z6C8_9HYPO
MSSSTNPDNINPQPTSDGGSVAVGIVLGILAGIFVVLVLLSRLLCKNRGGGSPEDLEAGKRKRLASILKLDGVAPSRAYGNDQEKAEPEPKPPASCSFDNVIVCAICLDVLKDDDMVRRLPCQHYFHSSCLDTWYLRQHNTCPLCKTPFFDQSQKKEKKAVVMAESSSQAAGSQTI